VKWCALLVFFTFAGILSSQESNPFDIPNARGDVEKTHSSNISSSEDMSRRLETSDSSSYQEKLDLPSADSTISPQEVNPFDISSVPTASSVTKEKVDQDGAFKSPLDLTNFSKGNKSDTNLLVLVFVLIMLVILSLAVSLDRKRCGDVFRATINSNSLKTLYRDTNAWTNGQIVILYLSFFLISSFLIWLLALKHFGGTAVHLGWVVLALVLCYLIRHFTIWVLGSVYPLGVEVGQFNYSIMLHNIVLAIFLLPLVLAVEFMTGIDAKTYVYIALGLFLLVYVFRQVKGIISLVSMRGFNPLYFFIYLCAVEIAPIMV